MMLSICIQDCLNLFVDNVGGGSNITQNYLSASSNMSSSLQKNGSIELFYIIGLFSQFTELNFSLSLTKVQTYDMQISFGVLSLSTGATTSISNITITYVIYNPSSSIFLSYGGEIRYPFLTLDQYSDLAKQFMPTYYTLYGWTGLTLTANNSKQLSIFITTAESSILDTYSDYTIDALAVSYLMIGVHTDAICSPCNNYIAINTCLDTCPNATYAYQYADGAKACLACSLHLGLILNELSTGCNCLPGYSLQNDQCIRDSLISNTCASPNTILNGSQCVCIPNTHNISGTCSACLLNQTYSGNQCVNNSRLLCSDPNSSPNSDNTACLCNLGYTSNGTLCLPAQNCPPNALFDDFSQTCQCQFGLVNISNTCSVCGPQQRYDAQQTVCICIGTNQQVNSNGLCECTTNSHNISGQCVVCPSGSLYNGTACASRSQVLSCGKNQVQVNGICLCNSRSIALGSICIACSDGFYPNKINSFCDGCISNCLICQNSSSCDNCVQGYHFQSGSCVITNSPNNSTINSTAYVTIKNAYPAYTTAGIATDFLLKLPINTIKTPQQLRNQIKIFFFMPSTIPKKILWSQNSFNLSAYRIFFYYNGLTPSFAFTVRFEFIDEVYGVNQNITLTYDPVKNAVVYLLP